MGGEVQECQTLTSRSRELEADNLTFGHLNSCFVERELTFSDLKISIVLKETILSLSHSDMYLKSQKQYIHYLIFSVMRLYSSLYA